jgi:3-oxoacyl-(acyl-carrier-protein) synthase
MSAIYITGLGAVSPAGWTAGALRDALAKGQLLPAQDLPRPGQPKPLRVLRVPPAASRPSFMAHARLRRASPITQYAVGAAVEAAGEAPAQDLGVIVCVFSGCVNYSQRFYHETLKNPATASPLVFPETVFNAPASHIAACLGTNAINYTLVGDSGTFLHAMAIATHWLGEEKVAHCLVVGTEEIDWLSSEAVRLFDRSKFMSEGAGAILLSRNSDRALARLESITDEFLYHSRGGKTEAMRQMRAELAVPPGALLCDSTSGTAGISGPEQAVWSDWRGPRISPKKVLGEGLMASAAWQVAAAADLIYHGAAPKGIVSIAGFHQHAIGCTLAAL